MVDALAEHMFTFAATALVSGAISVFLLLTKIVAAIVLLALAAAVASAAWNRARTALEPAWNRAVAAFRGAIASKYAVPFTSIGYCVLAVVVSQGKVSKAVAYVPATALLVLAALVGANNTGLRALLRTQMDTRGFVHFWFSAILLAFAAAIFFSDKALDFPLSSFLLARIAALAGAVIAETIEKAWNQANNSAIKLVLRGNDEEAAAGGNDDVCVVCHVNKAVVASACCFRKTTCLSCSRTLYQGKTKGSVKCMNCQGDVKYVGRIL